MKNAVTQRSLRLCILGRWCLELGAEDPVPEAAGNTKSVLEVGKVVLEVVFLEPLIVRRKATTLA